MSKTLRNEHGKGEENHDCSHIEQVPFLSLRELSGEFMVRHERNRSSGIPGR